MVSFVTLFFELAAENFERDAPGLFETVNGQDHWLAAYHCALTSSEHRYAVCIDVLVDGKGDSARRLFVVREMRFAL